MGSVSQPRPKAFFVHLEAGGCNCRSVSVEHNLKTEILRDSVNFYFVGVIPKHPSIRLATSKAWSGCWSCFIFTALHGMQTRSYDEISVRLSVCQTRALWQNGRKLCLDFYIIRKNIYPSSMRRRMVGGGRPLLPEILGQPARVGAKSPILNR